MRMPPWPAVPMWNNKFKHGSQMMESMLAKLGSPQNKLPPVIHIAGTNGKGSSLAMLKSIYEAAGYKVSAYSSPHLVDFNERIYLAGSYISDEYIYDLINRCKQVADELGYQPGFFEGTTLMAFLAFAETPADIVILETGMGGRLDCTNVVAKPIATLITTIGLDHTEYLGDTIEAIAKEKAGIMKSACPCIIGPQQNTVYDTLFAIAEQKDVETIAYEYDYGIAFDEEDANHFRFLHNGSTQHITLPIPSLQGDHQLLNASAVVATILAVNNHLPVTIESIRDGLAQTKWPGRIEKIAHEKKKAFLSDCINLYLDGAHNDAGALVLGNWLSKQNTPTILILGMTKNRDPNSFVKNLNYNFLEGLTVTVESEPSSFESANLAQKINCTENNFKHLYTIEEALKCVEINYNIGKYGSGPINVIVTGSLFLVADCYKLML